MNGEEKKIGAPDVPASQPPCVQQPPAIAAAPIHAVPFRKSLLVVAMLFSFQLIVDSW